MVLTQNQESLSLEQHCLVTQGYLTKVLKSVFDEFLIRNQLLHNVRPGLVKGFVPYTRGKVSFYCYFFTISYLSNLSLLLLYLLLPLLIGHLVDFVNKHEDVCILIELFDTA